MAVTAKLFGSALAALASGSLSWASDNIKVSLHTASYVPDQDAHQYYSSVTNEISGTGYTAGGATLASKTSTYTAATNTQALDAADVVWTGATWTGARIAVIRKDTGSAATSPLLGWVDLGADGSPTAAPFTITWDAAGIFTLATA